MEKNILVLDSPTNEDDEGEQCQCPICTFFIPATQFPAHYNVCSRHGRHLEHSLQLARSAVEHGNHPFGSILVASDGETVVETAENEVLTSKDVTRHAELVLISQASKRFSRNELSEMTVYTSTEPCPMCSGAIYWSGVKQVYYLCSVEALDEVVSRIPLGPGEEPTSLPVPSQAILCLGAGKPVQTNPAGNPEQAIKLHEEYWLNTMNP